MSLVGIDYPFRKYPDFGNLCYDDIQAIEQDLDFFKSMGVNAVRWWLLADGNLYGTGSDTPILNTTDNKWHFSPPLLDPHYKKIKEDLDLILSIFEQKGMYIIPSLLDFKAFYQGMTVDKCIVKQGRADLILDTTKRDFFIKNVFKALLDVSVKYKDIIYAWEVLNEPEWPVKDGIVTQNQMIDFLYACINFVNTYKNTDGTNMFNSTIGWAYAKDIIGWNLRPTPYLGVTLHQFHYYPYPGSPQLPLYSTLPHPCIVGEYQSQHIENPCKNTYNWKELPIDKQTVYYKIKLINSYGYPAGFIWARNNKDQLGPGEWDQITVNSLIQYHKEISLK